jgi:hypothetical protein
MCTISARFRNFDNSFRAASHSLFCMLESQS